MIKSRNLTDEQGRQHHIKCLPEQVGRYVLLPGDPFRTEIIAKHLDQPFLVAHNREHKTYSGYLDGQLVTVTSTGMGGPSTAIAVEELIHCGAQVIIRVGTCGRLCPESYDDSLKGLIITGAIRDEGTTRQYIPIEYPAIADLQVVNALIQAAKGQKFAYGLVQSKDSFYGQIDPDSMPNGALLKQRWKAWEKAGIMGSEMEASTLFVVAAIRQVKAGAIMAYGEMNDATIDIACQAIRLLIKADQKGHDQ
jgi:uridine phosphorylase